MKIINPTITFGKHFSNPVYIQVNYNESMTLETKFERIIYAYKNSGEPHSQTAIGESLGITQGAVGAWKRGGQLWPENVDRICEITGYSQEWIKSGRGPKKPYGKEVSDLIDSLEELGPATMWYLSHIRSLLSNTVLLVLSVIYVKL